MDRWANRGELKRDRRFAELLDGARAPHGAKSSRKPAALHSIRDRPSRSRSEHRGGAEVVFGRDEDEAVGLRDRGGPSLHDLALVKRATRHAGGTG